MTATERFAWTLRVYWEDTDAGGLVFYANHLKFFERARTEWLRSLGFSQERLRSEQTCMFIVTDTALRYLRPARLDDLLTITVGVRDAGRASMALLQQAWRPHIGPGAELISECTIRIACVHTLTLRPRRIPADILEAIA
jgi:acyl-CoA thioester hydrolase